MTLEPSIVIFGDSYSVSAECDVDKDEQSDGKTWADYIPELLNIQTEQIQNFSTPGASAEEDLDEQIARFSNQAQRGWDHLSLSSATYVLFLGINDCGQNTADRLGPIVDKVIGAAQTLLTQYGAQALCTEFGAREFVFVDIPPTDRAPAAVRMECGDTVQGRVNTWNDYLRAKVAGWAAEMHSRVETHTSSSATGTQAQTYLFSSHEVITDILDEPEKYGLSKEDVAKDGGEIWVDDLHLSSAVHRILAERIAKSIPCSSRSQ